MIWARNRILSMTFVAAMSVAVLPAMPLVAPAQAAEVKYVVDGIPVTTYDIQRRAAFLKLQRRKGNASDDMIEQTLRMAEVQRLNIRVTDEQVDASYERFAKSNKMSTKQLDGVLSKAGVTRQHFKEYIRAQMSWGQALGRRARGGGKLTEQEMVRKMLEKGGAKPSATEYMLQQVIFVVPAKERGALMGKRKREAEAMRARFNGCDSTRQFAKGLIDVTVRDLGRILEPQLPPEWAESIKATSAGGATGVRETEKGVEFIGICRAREVSDDRVAQMMLGDAGEVAAGGDELSKKYTAELREKAQVVER